MSKIPAELVAECSVYNDERTLFGHILKLLQNTCKESVTDCNGNDVEKDEKDLEDLVDSKSHHPVCGRVGALKE